MLFQKLNRFIDVNHDIFLPFFKKLNETYFIGYMKYYMSKKTLKSVLLNEELKSFHNIVNSIDPIQRKLFVDISQIRDKMIDHDYNKKGYLSLVIKYLIRTDNIEWLNLIIEENFEKLRSNDCLSLINYLKINSLGIERKLNKGITSNVIFALHVEKFHFSSKSIEYLINNNLKEFLYNLDGYYSNIEYKREKEFIFLNKDEYNILEDYTKINKGSCSGILSKINIFIDRIFEKIDHEKYKNSIYSFFEKLSVKSEKFSKKICVLDCGNILHFVGRKLSAHGYKFLIDIIEKLLSNNILPVLVTHKRHFEEDKFNKCSKTKEYIEYMKKGYGDLMFYTPYYQNDDYFILIISLIGKFKILTNDNYGDHLSYLRNKEKDFYFQIDYLVKDLLINFSSRGKLNEPNIDLDKLNKNYSNCVQIIDNCCYIPLTNGNFLKIEI